MRKTESLRLRRAFTLIELLLVVTIIGILSAILIPTTAAVRVSAKRAQTKVLFAQWATAIEQFRQEYGYYPDVTTPNRLLDPTKFFAALTGRDFAGHELTGPALNGNKRRLALLAVFDTDQLKDAAGHLDNSLTDAFGNSEVVILTDDDGDGLIRRAELVPTAVRPGNRVNGYGPAVAPDPANYPPEGVRAAVLLYSAGRGRGEEDIVCSRR
ncbi:MAG: type II secretion system protein [Opitutales bacterium]